MKSVLSKTTRKILKTSHHLKNLPIHFQKHFLTRQKGVFLLTMLLVGIGLSSFFPPPLAHAATYTWDGGGADNNWSTCANWSTDTCPTSSDSVIFDSTSTKNSTIDLSWGGTLVNVSINSGYTGTITMARSLTLTGTFTQSAGIFTAADQTFTGYTVTVNTGSNFTASSGTMKVRGNFTINSGATFAHNNGTIIFDGVDTGSYTLSCGNKTFNLVAFSYSGPSSFVYSYTVNSDCNLPLGNNPNLKTEGTAWTCPSFNLNGTLSGTGTLTFTGCAFQINSSTAAISGFSTISFAFQTAARLVIANTASFDASSFAFNNLGSITVNTGGTFTAPSGTLNIGGDLTINGTFNHNNGTVNFSSSSSITQTLVCSGNPFNLVTVNQTNSTASLTIGSGCTIPVGANPILTPGYSGGITVNGAVSGTGTLYLKGYYNGTTYYNPKLTLSCGSSSCLSGFTGIDWTTANSASLSFSVFTVSGTGTSFDVNSYSIFNFAGGLAVSSSASFTAPSGNFIITGGLSISSGTTFNVNGGTITFDGISGGSNTISCGNVTFNKIAFTYSSGTNYSSYTVNSDCTLPLGNNPTLKTMGNAWSCPGITLNGILTGTGTLTYASCLMTFNSSTANISGFSNITNFSNYPLQITLSNNAVWNAGTVSNITGVSSITINSGSTFTAPSGILEDTGNFTNNGTFNHNSGTVNFTGSSNQTITGTGTFNNVQITGGSSKTMTFPASTTQTILNNLTITGTGSGSRVLLRSSSSGTQWGIDVRGSSSVVYANIQDSNACQSAGRPLIAINSTNSTNNSCWTFVTSGAQNPTFILKGVTIGPGTRISGN